MKRLNLKDTLSGWGMMVGCVVVMLGALALFARGDTSSWGVLVLLLCPLMHIFMHKRMHGGSHHQNQQHAQEPAGMLENEKIHRQNVVATEQTDTGRG